MSFTRKQRESAKASNLALLELNVDGKHVKGSGLGAYQSKFAVDAKTAGALFNLAVFLYTKKPIVDALKEAFPELEISEKKVEAAQ